MSKLSSFNKKLADYTKGVNKNRTRFLPFVSTTVSSIEKSKLTDKEVKELKGFFRELVQYFPSGSELLSVLDQITPSFMFSKVYPNLESWLQTKLVEHYVSLFGITSEQGKSALSIEQAKNFLQTIKQHPEYFESNKNEIKKGIEEKFSEQVYLSLFKDVRLQELFISEMAVENFVKTINQTDQDLVNKLEFLLTLKIDSKVEVIFDRFVEILKLEAGQGARDVRLFLADSTRKFVSKFETEVNEIQVKTKIQELSNSVITFYSQEGQWPNKSIFVKLMLVLKRIMDNPVFGQLESKLKDFTSNSTFESWQRISKEEVKELVVSYPSEFRIAAVRDFKILEMGINYLPDGEKVSLVSNLLDKARSLPPEQIEQKELFYEKVSGLKCASDPALTIQFVTDLVNIKASAPDIVKKYSRKQFLSSEQKNQLKV